MHIHFNVSSQSIFLVWKRNCGYFLCEGGIAGLEAKALVWKPNLGTSSHSLFIVRERNYGTSKHYSLCGSGISDLKVTQYSMCGSGNANLKSQYIVVRRRNCGTAYLKSKNIPCAEAELKVTPYSLCGSGTVELQVTDHSVCGGGTSSHRIL